MANLTYFRKTLIKLVSDNVKTLRPSDVYRLVSECPKDKRAELVQWVAGERPDLAEEAKACLAELES